MRNITRIFAAILLVCVMLLQVPSFGAEKTIDEAAQEVLDRFNKYDVQWVGDWEKAGYAPEYLGEGIFAKLQKNGELHLIDAAGTLLNNLGTGKDWEFKQFVNGICKFRDMETYNYGLLNNKGKVIFQPSSPLINEFSEGLCAFKDDKADAWGYINVEGKVVIAPKFSWAEEFKNGVAYVWDITAGIGYINTKGDYLIPPEYDWLSEYGDLIAVLKVIDDDIGMRECYGFIDKNGKAVTELNYGWASGLTKEGLACAENEEGLYGYIDKTGKAVIPFQYRFAGPFSEGLAFVCNDEGKFGYIDKTGKTVIPFIFDDADSFSEGLAAATAGKPDKGSDPLFGYINTKGEFIIPMKVANAGRFKDGIALFSTKYDAARGIIDKTGKILIEKECEEFDYRDGLVKYRIYKYSTSPLADRHGYIDKTGKDAGADSFYTYLSDFSEGLSAYIKQLSEVPYQNSVCGYMDKSFQCILEDKNLSKVGDFKNGVAVIKVYASQGKETQYRTGLIKSPFTALKAVPTQSKIMVNGKQVSMEAYGINGNNYFKLRDLAKIVSGTQKQFEVTWDGEKKAINLVSNKSYTAVGGELAAGDGKDKSSNLNLSKVFRDGQEVYLKAYTIKGNNYFKLRDVAKAFDIGITWDASTGTIGINTDSGYVD